MEITEQTITDIKRLLEEGIDDFWWTCEYDGNYSLINRLRKIFELEIITEENFKNCQEYWRNL
jgi:hypothetical protein